jgi:hypothetical protein
MEIGWTDVGSGRYILVSCAHSNTSCIWVKKKNHQLLESRIQVIHIRDIIVRSPTILQINGIFDLNLCSTTDVQFGHQKYFLK